MWKESDRSGIGEECAQKTFKVQSEWVEIMWNESDRYLV